MAEEHAAQAILLSSCDCWTYNELYHAPQAEILLEGFILLQYLLIPRYRDDGPQTALQSVGHNLHTVTYHVIHHLYIRKERAGTRAKTGKTKVKGEWLQPSTSCQGEVREGV